jgi:ATP-binding cassette subfamily F protein uup
VAETDGLSYGWEGKPIIKDLSCTILRGDRTGIIGPNGSGKTTLLNLLLGKLQPDSGSVRLGSKLEIAYFDQLRGSLDESRSVRDNLAGGSDKVDINGKQKHVIGYLQDFLFTPDRASQPVSSLSGGERNRLLLAKLFTKPFNILVMDEPTNDLDVETLELLEELLLEYQGTLLLVSHDREFLNNVVTSTLVLAGDGRVAEYVGGYDDWLRQRKPEIVERPAVKKRVEKRPAVRPKKLSYREQQELEQLPQKIESLDRELAELQQKMADPALYRQGGAEIAALKGRLEELETELEQSYTRWEELDSLPR